MNGEKLNHLRFADDIVIIANNFSEMESMLQELDVASRRRGLKMNMKKTKVMADLSVQHKPITIDGTQLEHVSEYIYLGQRFTLTERNQDNEIRRRIKTGWQTFGRYSHFMKGNLPLCLKKKVYDQCILPSMTYASETWSLTTKMERKLAAAQHNMERSMLNITYKDRKTNKWIREQTKVKDIMKVIKQRKWKWAGHVSRRRDGRWSTKITEWTPLDGKRNRGRQRKRWRDEIGQFWHDANWYKYARERDKWRDHAEAFIQQWIDNG